MSILKSPKCFTREGSSSSSTNVISSADILIRDPFSWLAKEELRCNAISVVDTLPYIPVCNGFIEVFPPAAIETAALAGSDGDMRLGMAGAVVNAVRTKTIFSFSGKTFDMIAAAFTGYIMSVTYSMQGIEQRLTVGSSGSGSGAGWVTFFSIFSAFVGLRNGTYPSGFGTFRSA
jgi:hypothetical protein